ncbi:MAG: alpha/beta hydrolase [Myxococcota bacterium]|nr:alpha/beta hydrolase [Myxococcota bacterium]
MADAIARAVQVGGTFDSHPDELHRVPTADGASIALARYQPRDVRRFVEPVILCHGLGANRLILDLDDKYSLARYLARAGFETWVMELRGRGLAGPPLDATFDAQAEHDVGAALKAVLAAGHREVTWVGHSKGGLVLYAHLAKFPKAPVKAAVIMGSPATFAVQPGLKRFVRTLGPLLKMASVPASRLGALSLIGGPPPGPITKYLIREENVDVEVARRTLAAVASDIPGGVARQFADWVNTGRFCTVDGGYDYRLGMEGIRIPMLLMAGSQDYLAPPLAVARAKDHLKGPIKWVVAGKAHGFAEDYGHSDLVIGRKAPEEIFPLVASYLAAQSTAVGRPSGVLLSTG